MRCAYCHEAASEGLDPCPDCGALLHVECWTTAGNCPTLGCGHSRGPAPRPLATGDPAETAVQGYCADCSERIQGLALPGDCPRCRRKIASSSFLMPRPLPGTASLLGLYAWPLGALLATLPLFAASSDQYAMIGWLLLVIPANIVSVINGGIVTAVLLRRHLPTAPAIRQRSFFGRLKMLGLPVFALFVLAVILPSLGLGGCLVLAMMGG